MSSLWEIIKQEENNADKPFHSHFQNQNLSWEELLSDDRIVSSFKNQNPQLLKYMNQHPQIYSRMVEYITTDPQEEDSEERKHRYPFVSGELLSIQSSIINEAFFGVEDDSEGEENQHDSNLLDKLLAYPPTLSNPLLIGYCEKVFNNLYQRKRAALTQYWLHKYSFAYVKLLSNMNICNIVKKVVTLPEEEGEEMFVEARAELLRQILDSFGEEGEEYRSNAIDIFREIFGKYLMISNGRHLLQLILDSSSSYLHGDIEQHTLSFIRDLLIKTNAKSEQKQNTIHLPLNFIHDLNVYIVSAIKTHQASTEQLLNQSRAKVTILGKPRMFLIQTTKELVKINTLSDNQRLVENNLSEWLLGLVSEFKFNSILHCAVQSILLTLLHHDTRKNLLESHKLVEGLCDLLESAQNNIAFGQLVNIFLFLNDSQDPTVQGIMKMPRVINVYEDVVLPRKEKNEFKWAGSLTNFKSQPLNFVEEQPNSYKSPDVAAKPKASPDFDFDFKTVMPKTSTNPVFDPFATPSQPTESKPVSSSAFNFF